MTTNAYLSFDIETDGPGVLTNSMLSLGIVLINSESNIIDELEIIFIKEMVRLKIKIQ